jgi:hypothetical protein
MVNFLIIACVIIDFCNADEFKFRIVSIFSIFLLYLILFLHLRLFDRTAILISMIYSILSDMRIFALIFSIAIFGFGNIYYVLASQNEEDIVGETFPMSFIFMYRTALGDFQTDNFDKLEINT